MQLTSFIQSKQVFFISFLFFFNLVQCSEIAPQSYNSNITETSHILIKKTLAMAIIGATQELAKSNLKLPKAVFMAEIGNALVKEGISQFFKETADQYLQKGNPEPVRRAGEKLKKVTSLVVGLCMKAYKGDAKIFTDIIKAYTRSNWGEKGTKLTLTIINGIAQYYVKQFVSDLAKKTSSYLIKQSEKLIFTTKLPTKNIAQLIIKITIPALVELYCDKIVRKITHFILSKTIELPFITKQLGSQSGITTSKQIDNEIDLEESLSTHASSQDNTLKRQALVNEIMNSSAFIPMGLQSHTEILELIRNNKKLSAILRNG